MSLQRIVADFTGMTTRDRLMALAEAGSFTFSEACDVCDAPRNTVSAALKYMVDERSLVKTITNATKTNPQRWAKMEPVVWPISGFANHREVAWWG